MSQNKKRILAIDPGTRYMGVALLEDGKLLYHAVKVIKKQKSPHETLIEGRSIILTLIHDLKPKILAIEKTFFANNRNTSILNVFVDEIKTIGKRKGLKVVSFAPGTVKKFITGNGRAKKAEVARVLVLKFPELRVFLTQDRAYKERFHQNMFDAVAIGMLAATQGR